MNESFVESPKTLNYKHLIVYNEASGIHSSLNQARQAPLHSIPTRKLEMPKTSM